MNNQTKRSISVHHWSTRAQLEVGFQLMYVANTTIMPLVQTLAFHHGCAHSTMNQVPQQDVIVAYQLDTAIVMYYYGEPMEIHKRNG